ncbi:putative NADPH-quinone reductase (modulator of drug activity B) [Desulfosporosinus orientis DSM 765]|uniref:Putative NADPH-quinone reductase (Modulator of drug activity B) n=1 Tax=Desulfosporosinus orientis (strain ATCC 19365 / DSM 765 / NCIMB 8382 / VKM B-1628 / Singapore I) TaxID=768706 RepID=G7WHR4_DESOD|nr:NAD(P)H-dependent oxidoreductase [Desulfosporosinus orientis]AET69626.1 putative NADPH-quinone reductase (modulator of drug activity B) [Desulfosporosinus orientis DSM 765]
MNVVLVSASPKIKEKSVSKEFLEMAGGQINADLYSKTFIDVRKSFLTQNLTADFETLANANIIIISFPLYYFCMPGMLTRFLVDYHNYYTARGTVKKNVKVYAIVNCGFPEPEINLEAVRVIKSFCPHINAEFRFGVLIGGGAMMIAAKDAPFMKKTLQNLKSAFSAIAADIQDESSTIMDSINIGADFPFFKRVYYFMGGRGWITTARKNGLKKKDLYKKPYRLSE